VTVRVCDGEELPRFNGVGWNIALILCVPTPKRKRIVAESCVELIFTAVAVPKKAASSQETASELQNTTDPLITAVPVTVAVSVSTVPAVTVVAGAIERVVFVDVAPYIRTGALIESIVTNMNLLMNGNI
jgi:hypothetical protein